MMLRIPLWTVMSDLRPCVAAALLAALAATPAAAQPTFPDVRTVVTDHCGRCHGEKVQKGGLNLAPFADEKAVVKHRKTWREVAAQMKSGEMPPEGAKQPTKDQRERVVAWITKTLDAADEQDRRRPDPGPALVRRLNRFEYNRTVRDLTGIDLDAAGAVGMPDDTVGEAFDNLAAALNVSDTLMEKYFAAADLILDKLYAAPKKGPSAFRKVVFASPAWLLPRRDAARLVVESFARRAYRRPVEPREVERLLTLFDKSDALPYDAALRPVLKAVLVSPNFLLRIERDRKQDAPYRVTDHELAVRLSYFLWSSQPDDKLSALASRGELGTPGVFDTQVKRMLADPKARALTDGFAAQWLQLRKLPDARPTTEFFPTFTPKLRQAMHDEVALFFDGLRKDDRPVTDLLNADYTYLNADLAKHYGVGGVTGPEMRRVRLTDPNRGGLLGMGAVLAVTSHTNRTSPTLRGKYVLDVILGTPPPPPPPGVSQLDEAKPGKEAKTFREKLAQHAAQPSCAGCHAKIDPLGFGLETFDAVGRVRKADATGALPTGEKFDGPKELRGVLLSRKPQFVRNVVEKTLTYALGRELAATDKPAVDAVVAEMEKNEYTFSALVGGVARSYPFRHRRDYCDEP